MTSSPAQPCAGGLDAHSFMSNQTAQSSVEHLRGAKIITEKQTWCSSASPATLTTAVSTGQHEMGRWKHRARWEHERHTARIQLREGHFPTNSLVFSRLASNSFPREPQEQELTGAHRLAWILLNIQWCSLILLGISLEIPAKQGSSRASQTALRWTHCLKCAILQKCSRTPAVLLWLDSD